MLLLVALFFSSCAVKDFDSDGYLGNWDACPHQAEDLDAWQDHDGCPDPDNDEDGVLDSLDKCKFIPEDLDGFKDLDGCPEDNNDLDSLKDFQDKCPNKAEDYDGFLDSDGCPDLDNDRDHVLDSLDVCPFEPEDKDGFEDLDGCPDTDNDKDGIMDEADACPNEPGAKRVYVKGQKIGCPELSSVLRLPEILSIPLAFSDSNTLGMLDKILLDDQIVQSLIEFKEQSVQIRIFVLKGEMSDGEWINSINRRSTDLREYLTQRGVGEKQARVQLVDLELLEFFDENNQSLDAVRAVEFRLLK